jgi:predicted nucleic acid-binding protein
MWDKSDKASEANRLLFRIKNKEFNAITPSFLLSLLSRWDYSRLVEEITDFYEKHTEILTNKDIDERINEVGIDDRAVLEELKKQNIKDEDALLIFVASIFEADFLVTFNRKHLLNKKEKINEVLRKNGLRTIGIIEPSEAP